MTAWQRADGVISVKVGLTRLRLHPRPIGTSRLVDGAKAWIARPIDDRLARRQRTTPGR
jgi:hypothetical protein